jgi:beta-glucanase (GH16 family)
MNRRAFVATALAAATAVPVLRLLGEPAGGPSPGRLLWSEEFDGPAGAAADPANWAHQTGRYGQASGERQYYTDGQRNAWQDGQSHLVILPRHEQAPDGLAAGSDYTSGRLVTRGLHEFRPPVRIQARIKVPTGYGVTAAFWTLGADPQHPETWPHEGEIDIVEAIRNGNPTGWLPQTIHGPSRTDGSHVALGNNFRGTGALDRDFHRFGIDWRPDRIDFHLDEVVVFSATPAAFAARGGDWTPFSGRWPHYLLLGTAVLGVEEATIVPEPMLIDWVRVWSLA